MKQMGLFRADIMRLAHLFEKAGTENKSLCMMGKQDILMNRSSLLALLKRCNVRGKFKLLENADDKNALDSYTVFKMLGFSEVHAADISPYEGADILFDLAKDLPRGLVEKFDYVLDAGTLEHIFDLPCALRNMSNMVKAGGSVIHIVPLFGWLNHGFHNFSPILFEEFYQANNWKINCLDMEFLLFDGKESAEKWKAAFSQDCRLFAGEDINKYIRQLKYGSEDKKRVLLWCVAERLPDSTVDIFPQQGMWKPFWENASKM